MAASADGRGYWLVSADGGVFAFGDASYYGTMSATRLNKPIVGMAASADGRGYWLVSADGGVFAFGDASYYGTMSATSLNKPIVGMAASADGRGYWLVSADGGVFAFGDASYYGTMSATRLNKPIVGMAASADGRGYWLVSANGGVFAFGDASYYGGVTKQRGPRIAALVPIKNGYYLVTSARHWVKFGGSSTAPVPEVVGNQLLNRENGQPLRLLGLDASGTESACIEDKGFAWGASDATEAATIAAWSADVVRVPLNEDCWLGINGAPPGYSGTAYQDMIAQWVQAINAAGMVAILDLHVSAPGQVVATGMWPMADQDHSVTFWSQVAARFSSDPSVIFDLFNEPSLGNADPTAADWSCWLNGCSSSYDNVTYQVAGMQELLDAVRAAGATQPVMVGGLNYAGDPCGIYDWGGNGGNCAWLAYEPTDPEHQLIDSFHTYNWTACTTLSCWDSGVLPVAARVPVVTGELGEDDCSAGYIDTYMQWADQHDISYLAWNWQSSSDVGQTCSSAPFNLLSNWDGTPSTIVPAGPAFAAHLAAIAARGK